MRVFKEGRVFKTLCQFSSRVFKTLCQFSSTARCVSPIFRQNVWPVVTVSGSSFAQGVSSARRPSVYRRRAA